MATPIAEWATLRNIRDIADGHLILWVHLSRFDLTGQRVDPPIVRSVNPDRLPAAGTPNPHGDWWQPLIEQGWLRLPGEQEASCMQVTADGLAEIQRLGKETGRG